MKNKKAFTLVEMLVTVGILGIVLSMTAGMVNYSVGKLRSARAKLLNDTIRSTFDIITQRMYNANDSVISTLDPKNNIIGFIIYNPGTPATIPNTPLTADINDPVILIVSSGEGATPTKICTYFSRDTSLNKLTMAQETCNLAALYKNRNAIQNSLTSDKVEVTGLKVKTGSYFIKSTLALPPRPTQIPFFELEVTAREKQDTNNTTQLKTTFTMDYENLNNLIPLLPAP